MLVELLPARQALNQLHFPFYIDRFQTFKSTFEAMAEVELPKQYKACVYDAPGKVSTKVEMLDMPEPGPGELLINL